MRGIIWFREDLRIRDNKALFYAAKQCSNGLVALYIIDTSMWKDHNVAACRIEFILRGLQVLSTALQKLNIPLILLEVTHTRTIPEEIFYLLQKYQAQALFFNKQYEANEARRDQAVTTHLTKQEYTIFAYDDQTILPPNSIKTQQSSYFKIFTPFKNAWQKFFQEIGTTHLLPAPKPQIKLAIKSSTIKTTITGFSTNINPDLWPAGEEVAQKQLAAFISNKLINYDKERDFPALEGTSKLSPYLASGMISPRQCFLAALVANNNEITVGNKGALLWMSELIWREFYKYILVAVPRVSMTKPYQLSTEKINWKYNEKLLIAWQQGQTGYPIVDAAMRQLNTTGWMHNRLRMIVAMFFTKNLFLDWRLGERYFMQHLVDGDLAANNGGWQWCASTGVDAAPYFRVFNTVTQSKRFDPEGTFIRYYCPELAKLPTKILHNPSYYIPEQLQQYHYPQAIVDLAKTRQRFISTFKKLLKN